MFLFNDLTVKAEQFTGTLYYLSVNSGLEEAITSTY